MMDILPIISWHSFQQMASAALKTISENHLQCIICHDRYTKPKALDCIHSFCEKCLVDYYNDAKQMPCPVCRRETKLPQKGITGLKTNFYLESLLDEVSSLQRKDATLTKTPEDEARCQKHKGEIKRFYCMKCEKLICGNCTIIDHPKPEHHLYWLWHSCSRTQAVDERCLPRV